MIKCSICAGKFTKGKVCISCGKAYCKKETLLECPFCRIGLTEAQITEQKLGENVIEWLTLGTFRIGLVDFKEIPSFAFRLYHSSAFEFAKSHQIIVFPSKESSWKFYSYFRTVSEYDKIFEKSRYSIVFEPTKKKQYILLNLEAITPDTADAEFMIVFLSNVFSQIEVFREIDNKVIKEALGEVLFDYVHKLGIPFVTVDEDTKQYAQILPEDLLGIYAEYVALKKLAKDYLREVPNFLRYKIELIFSRIESQRLDSLPGIFDIVNAYVRLASVLALTQEYKPLEQYIENLFYSMHNKVKKKIENFPDVIKCIDTIIEELTRKEVYVSYESYLENVSKVFKNILATLRPRYLRVSEVTTLFEIGQKYERMIENGEMAYIPKIGSLEEFSESLVHVFRKEDVFPELRIVAGQTLQSILIKRILWENNYFAYLQGVKHVQELAQLIENSIPNIEERMGKIDGESCPLGYHDACLALIKFSQLSYAMNDNDSAVKLMNLSKRVAQQYNVLPIQVIHGWKEFVETHDYARLLEVYRFFLAIDYAEHTYVEKHLKTIGHLASAIFKREGRNSEFDEAENNALAIGELIQPIPIGTSYSDQAQSIQSSLAMCHLVRLFRHVLNASELDAEAPLKEALLESQAMSANITENDPFNKFALKTEILYSLTSGNLVRAKKACKKLKEQSSCAPLLVTFVDKVESWVSESVKQEGRRFLISLRFDTNEYDPWEKLFKKIVFAEGNKDLERHITSADAIVIAEGVTDAKVLEQFAQKLAPEKKIHFMDAEGFANMNYYSNARLAKSLRVPLFVVFDGDTSTVSKKKKIKEKLVKQITLPDDHVLTLKMNSIENYLLVPTAIKRAFSSVSKSTEGVEAFFKARGTKRGKKKVLNDLFRQLGLGKYDQEKAVQIASEMKISEIDEEIKTILSFIAASC